MTLLRDAVRRWSAVTADDIPPPVIEAARLHMLDAVGVGLAAVSLDQGAPWRLVAGRGDGAAATFAGGRADPAMAALVNGGLIHSLEYDDTHTASIIHGGAVLVPAALAAGEAADASFARTLRAYLLGYELLIRLGLAAPGAFQRYGFQVTSVAGPLAAALVAADLADLDEDRRVHAAGIALSQSSGVFEFLTNGATVKSMHPGWAAHGGLVAAKLAAAGLTGPGTAIEGARGLYASFARDGEAPARFAASLGDFGSRWHMLDVAYKFAPCCHYLHPFIEAAGSIAAERGSAAVEAVTLRIAAGAAPIVCEPWAEKIAPPDGHAARWSLPVVVAARLLEGEVGHDTFAKPASPAVLDLAARCRWEPLEPNRFPQAFEAEIECRLDDGRIIERRMEDVFGNASRPATRTDVLAKFRANAGRVLDDGGTALEGHFLGAGTEGFEPLAAALRGVRRGDRL